MLCGCGSDGCINNILMIRVVMATVAATTLVALIDAGGDDVDYVCYLHIYIT